MQMQIIIHFVSSIKWALPATHARGPPVVDCFHVKRVLAGRNIIFLVQFQYYVCRIPAKEID